MCVKMAALTVGITAGLFSQGCTRHTVDVQPIRIEPIYMTIDINVRVDRELDEFFDYKTAPPPPATPSPESAPPEPVVPTPESPGATTS